MDGINSAIQNGDLQAIIEISSGGFERFQRVEHVLRSLGYWVSHSEKDEKFTLIIDF